MGVGIRKSDEIGGWRDKRGRDKRVRLYYTKNSDWTIYSPASRLIDALSDEVSRETILEFALVLERVVLLRVGHASALEPAIEHFRHALQVAFAHARRDGQTVDAEVSEQ